MDFGQLWMGQFGCCAAAPTLWRVNAELRAWGRLVLAMPSSKATRPKGKLDQP